ncbi:MAG: carboxypeptidase regulatory-like domain-containing protein [Candidatus Acidiferrum sp.]
MNVRRLTIALVVVFFALLARLESFTAWKLGAARADNPAGVSVTGVVKVEGQLPQEARISMNADPSCAKAHPGAVPNEDFVVGSGGTLGNVVVFIADGLGNRTFEVPAQAAVVEQKGCVYMPHVAAIRANQKLQVVNNDATTHNIHPIPANNREWNKAEPPGSTVEETFAREEVAIPIKCNVHPWMRAYVSVFKHPFFSISGKDGHFQLRDLPPGEYTVEAWHEKLGTLKQKLVVASGESKNLEFVFKAQGH